MAFVLCFPPQFITGVACLQKKKIQLKETQQALISVSVRVLCHRTLYEAEISEFMADLRGYSTSNEKVYMA